MEELLRELGAVAAKLRALIEAYERMRSEIEGHQEDARRRLSLIDAWIAGSRSLMSDGWPALPNRAAEVMEEIRNNLTLLNVAFETFEERMLTTKATLTIGPEVPVTGGPPFPM